MATEHRSAAKTIPRFTPRHGFPTFALRLGPFGSLLRDGAPVCSETNAFRKRNGDLNVPDGAPVCSENAASFLRAADPAGNHRFAADRMLVPVFAGTVSPLRSDLPDPGRGPGEDSF